MGNHGKQFLRIIPAVGFAVLSALSGIGFASIVVGILANQKPRSAADELVAGSLPTLALGGALGFVAGVVVSIAVLKQNAARDANIEERYVGAGGRLKIYFGVPVLILVLLFPLLRSLGRLVGQNADVYVILGVVLVVVALSLMLYDHIPPRLVIPLSVVAWMLALLFVAWYWFFGPGAPGHE